MHLSKTFIINIIYIYMHMHIPIYTHAHTHTHTQSPWLRFFYHQIHNRAQHKKTHKNKHTHTHKHTHTYTLDGGSCQDSWSLRALRPERTTRPSATSVCGLKLLVYEALSFECRFELESSGGQAYNMRIITACLQASWQSVLRPRSRVS